MSSQAVTRRSLGIILVVAGALLFILNSGVSRVALRQGISSLELTSLRITGTAVALLLVALLARRSALRPPRGREVVVVLGLGLFGVAALQFFYFVAIDRLTISLALLLEFQAPFLVALWAKFVQRDDVSARLWWGLGLAVIGLAMATEAWRGASFDTLGVLAGLLAAAAFAAYFLLGEQAQTTMSSLGTMLWSFAVAAVVLNVVQPSWSVDADLGAHVSLLGTLDHLSLPLWTVVTSVVLLGTLLPFGLELAALRFIPATTVTAIAMLEPVGAAALGWAWHEEALGAVAVIGCILVVTGILLAERSRGDHPADPVALT
ncbi:DMT family transporter [Nocardioides sp. Y6]|uniref:DMT family transporter n=1 Tax=Nocardioides malaquae TaxID=2773426 RepID=A0ABR9RWN7_9ACTN|nr:DMT family transporter [Nocardioides malaquae]MBE7325977.1 DMT family transporter [Nocardioides malaquae]